MRADARVNRERIVDAAVAVFGAQGTDVSTEEVAAQAGVGIATVFRHFATKDELVSAAVARHLEGVLATARELEGDDDPARALGALVELLVAPGTARLTLTTTAADAAEETRSSARQLRLALGRALRRAQSAGVARPEVTVDQLHLLVRGVAAAAVTGGARRATVRGAVAVVLAGVGT